MSSPLYSVNVQERIVNASLNSSMFQNMLMGVYTMVYGTTMYLYISRNKSSTRVVVSMITVLYVLSLIDTVIQWYWLNQSMVVNGDTRLDTFFATIGNGVAPSLYIFDNFVYYLSFAVSDALLIWRCYHVWGMSRRIIAVPSVLFVGESALFVASVVLSVFSNSPVLSNATLVDQSDNVLSAYVIISLATTVVTTFLIAYRIHTSVASMNGSTSKRRFNHVMTMIVESAAAYSVALLPLALSSLIPSLTYVDSPGQVAAFYIEPVAGIVAGMAPTVLVARIVLKDGDRQQNVTSTLLPISNLKFGSSVIAVEQTNKEFVSIQDQDSRPGSNQREIGTTRAEISRSENEEKV